MSLSKQEFTDAGRSMLGRAQNGERLSLTKIVVGSGSATTPNQLWPLTALIHFEMDVAISSKTDLGGGVLLVEGSLRSDQAPHAFDLKELGVMAHIAAEADRLYSVSNVFLEPPNHIDPASPTIEVFKIKLIVDRIPTGNITVSISPSENVIGENLGTGPDGGWYTEALGNVLKFKRVKQGEGIRLTETDTDITIGARVLENNLDLYVPMSYVGAPPDALYFPTIQEAHDYLIQFTIPPSKFATIHLEAGVHDGRVGFTHPNSQQIYLMGRPRKDLPVTAINYVNPSSKNVNAAGGPAAGLIAGFPVYLMNVDAGWAGGCVINSLNATFMTCNTLKRDTQATYNINDTGTFGSARRVSWLPSVIYLANPNPGQPWPSTHVNVAAPNGLQVQNVCILGGYHGLSLGGTRSSIKDVYVKGAGVGISCGSNAIIVGWPSDVVVTDCDFGISGIGAVVAHNLNVNVCANACGDGISSGDGSVYGAVPGIPSISGKIYLSHCAQGSRNWGQTMSWGNVYYVCNDVGLEADYGGIHIFGQFSNFCGLNGTDLKANGVSFITYKKGSGQTPVCNPTAGPTGGNFGSYIQVIP